MEPSKLRRQIAFEAAQLMYQRQESEYYRAKMKAARRIHRGWVKPADLPSNAEIRDQVQMLARTHEGPQRNAQAAADATGSAAADAAAGAVSGRA